MPTLSFNQIGVWTVCFLLALDVYLRIAAHLREKRTVEDGAGVRVSPQPLEVKEHVTYATTGEMDVLKSDLERLRTEVREGFEKLSDERRTSVGNLHAKVDAANNKVDELSGQMKQLSTQVGLVLNKLLNSQPR